MKLICILILASVAVFFMGAASAADVTKVDIKNYQFQPAEVTLQKGGTVTWTNMDSMLHDVKSQGFESPDLKKGEQYSKTFDKPGTYDYFCEIHPGMKGKVIVK